MASLSESSGMNNAVSLSRTKMNNAADTFVESVVHPVTSTFSDLVNLGASWLSKGKGWLSRRRRRRDTSDQDELQPMENFLNRILKDFDWLFVAAKTTVMVLQERSVWESAKIVLIGLLMIANFAIAFTLPLYI